MRIAAAVAAAGVVLGATAAIAQEPAMSALEMAVACAPPPVVGGPGANAVRVIGTQDPYPRELLGHRDLVVLNGGTKAGLQINQTYFVRRQNTLGAVYGVISGTVHTLGWVRIVAANDATAIATVDHMCDGILAGDYLDPFVAPKLPPGLDRNDPTGEPNFTSLARVLVSGEDREVVATGEFMLIDRGSNEGVTPGARFAIYRDIKMTGMPLTSIAEAVVVTTGPHMSLTRVTSARDAVARGDYVAFRK